MGRTSSYAFDCFAVLLPASFRQHNVDNLFVCLLHAFPAKSSHIADRCLNTVVHNAVSVPELLSVQPHLIAEDARLYRRSDLCRTAWLCSVTDDA